MNHVSHKPTSTRYSNLNFLTTLQLTLSGRSEAESCTVNIQHWLSSITCYNIQSLHISDLILLISSGGKIVRQHINSNYYGLLKVLIANLLAVEPL